jgi:hypothetical protein
MFYIFCIVDLSYMLQNLLIEIFPILYQEHNGVSCDWASFNVTKQNKQNNLPYCDGLVN